MKPHPFQASPIGATARAWIIASLSLVVLAPVHAEQLEEARVTKTVNDVRILPPNRTPVPAKRGSVVSGATAVGTGDRSRAELEFSDKSLVRLGSNSIFAFKSGERELELQQGSMLLQVPKGRGDTKIKSLPITAAITGTTILFESSKPVLNAKGKEVSPGIVKLIVMEGSLEWSLNSDPRKKLKMVSGDMVVLPWNASRFPKKVKVDIGRIKQTSLLMDKGLGALPDMAVVDRAIAKQQATSGGLNNPRGGFPVKGPKPDLGDDRVVQPSRPDPVDPIVIPPRPER